MESQSRQRTRIKFCGITSLEDAARAVECGADALGLILVSGSPRRISLAQAQAIRRRIPPFVAAVALLRNPQEAEVREVLTALAPDLLQFHGEETAAFCERFGARYVKAIAMGGAALAPVRGFPNAAALLFDGHEAGALGGQGQAFEWSRIAGLTAQPLILAGGLKPENVGEAILGVRPFAVDVASGIESAPGKKDSGKMLAFVRAVARADRELAERASA